MAEKEEFFDEKILEYRRRARNEKYSTLETGIYIKDELIQFERKEFFSAKLSIMLPISFVKMPSKLARVKYISQQRPQIIMTSLDTTVNFGMSMTDAKMQVDQIKIVTKQMMEALKRLNPAFAFYDKQFETKYVPLGWFEFKSYGIDTDVYNLMLISIIDGKMMHGVFNCDYADVLEWRDVARQIIYSIQDISAKGDCK